MCQCSTLSLHHEVKGKSAATQPLGVTGSPSFYMISFSVFHLSLPPLRAISRWGENHVKVQYEIITLSFWCYLPYSKKKTRFKKVVREKRGKKKIWLLSETMHRLHQLCDCSTVISYMPRNIKTHVQKSSWTAVTWKWRALKVFISRSNWSRCDGTWS